MAEARQPFAWYDNSVVGDEDKAVIDPLALIARAAALLEGLQQTSLEVSNNTDWFGWGLSEACKALVETGNPNGIGLLFTGLETLCDPQRRARWPLHELCAPIRNPYTPIKKSRKRKAQ